MNFSVGDCILQVYAGDRIPVWGSGDADRRHAQAAERRPAREIYKGDPGAQSGDYPLWNDEEEVQSLQCHKTTRPDTNVSQNEKGIYWIQGGGYCKSWKCYLY